MIAYLNGEYLPVEDAKISPLDRGFLFGDGIYEAIPSYGGRTVALQLHIDRMKNGLAAIGIENPLTDKDWKDVAQELSERNGRGNLGIYFHVSRGNEGRRFHGFPKGVTPTVFGMVLEIAPHPPTPDRNTQKGLRVKSTEDLRWNLCHIKSTALLGNVLHFQESHSSGLDETILYNSAGELTEASSSNVFVVIEGTIVTPPLDNQKLPGISRHICLEALRAEGSLSVEERVVTINEARQADEIWITNSSKQIAPVVEMDGQPVGNGQVGEVWERATRIYEAAKFDF
ncbi:MAG: D-alanine transaminase [Candidatus Pelagisphaera sp.]|jgi:D-alanine transaminase